MTTDVTFTLDDVLNAARKIIEDEGGDYVYDPQGEGCTYSRQGTPSCLVGHVIYALEPDTFEKIKDIEEIKGGSQVAAALRGDGWIRENFWTPDAEVARQAMQDEQDKGRTWGEAVYAAENLGADAD